MKKVATYSRVSVHNNSELSLARQQERLMDYCQSKEYEVAHSTRFIGDRQMGNEMFMRCLRDAKEKGIDTIVMASTNRVAGTYDEMLKVAEAYEAAGIAIETLDGSHLFSQATNLILATLDGEESEVSLTETEEQTGQVFG